MSILSPILGLHLFPPPIQEQHGDTFTPGAISSWATPAQGSSVNASSRISHKQIIKDTEVQTGFAESCPIHLTVP